MKRVKKSLRAYQLLSSAFTAAIVVAAVALLSVAGASDAGNLTDAELFKSLSVVSGGFAIAYLGKHICTKNIQALERRIDRYIERRGMVDTFTMSSGVRMAHRPYPMPPLCLERYGVRYDGGLAAHVRAAVYLRR